MGNVGSFIVLDSIVKVWYTENGNITEIANASGVIQNKYWYDDLGQLTREDNNVTGESYAYTYDNAGNILTKRIYAYSTATTLSGYTGMAVYNYNDADWGDLLTSYKPADSNTAVAITYDTIGNPLSYYNGYTFTWAKGRQLASATNGTNTLSFTYNADGIRTSKTVNGVKHTYLLSGSTIMAEYWVQSGVQHVLIYLYDNTNSPVGMMYRTNAYAADTYDYFLFEKNLQGDIVAVYSSTGTLLATYKYDAWGNHTVEYQNGGGDLVAVVSNPFRYRGYYYDSKIGLYYLNSRYYDSNTGRFINTDAYVSTQLGLLGNNMYIYCLNDPVNLFDETGEIPKVIQDKKIHDYVLLDIQLSNPDLTMFNTGIYYNGVNALGGWGFCDLYNKKTGEVWELKKDVNKGSCKIENAQIQLERYVNGTLIHDPKLKLQVATEIIPSNTFYLYEGMYVYRVTYKDAGNGMLRYDYDKYLRKEYQDALDAAMYIVKTTAELLGKFMSGGFAAGTGMPIPIPVA